MLADVIDVLRCPVCGGPVELIDAVRCGAGHNFDVARQGYVNLQPGASTGTADTAAMVAARAEFLAAGHYDPLADAVAEAARTHLAGNAGADAPLIIDAGAGTGYWLARLLERVGGGRGLALDVSKFAARRAARAHPKIGAAVCDTWHQLPVADGAAALVLNVFAPRNAAEFARVLRADGALLVASPTPDHLAEVVAALGLLEVPDEKDARLDHALGAHFGLVSRDHVSVPLRLRAEDMRRIARMGPSAWHIADDELDQRLTALATYHTTATIAISLYRRAAEPSLDTLGP